MGRRISSSDLVGRTEPLDELRVAFDASRHGKTSVVFIEGEAGIGKSRLVTEFLDLVATGNVRVLQGHCLELEESALPLSPFVEAFRDLARDLSPDATPRR